MEEPRYTFFLAHARCDSERAKELRDVLHLQVEVFLDVCNLRPGDNWDVELPRHQRLARATVALVSGRNRNRGPLGVFGAVEIL